MSEPPVPSVKVCVVLDDRDGPRGPVLADVKIRWRRPVTGAESQHCCVMVRPHVPTGVGNGYVDCATGDGGGDVVVDASDVELDEVLMMPASICPGYGIFRLLSVPTRTIGVGRERRGNQGQVRRGGDSAVVLMTVMSTGTVKVVVERMATVEFLFERCARAGGDGTMLPVGVTVKEPTSSYNVGLPTVLHDRRRAMLGRL